MVSVNSQGNFREFSGSFRDFSGMISYKHFPAGSEYIDDSDIFDSEFSECFNRMLRRIYGDFMK
jgi:hypothetical protein